MASRILNHITQDSARGLVSRERSLLSVCAENILRYYVLVSYPVLPSSPIHYVAFVHAFNVSFRLDTPQVTLSPASHRIIFTLTARYMYCPFHLFCDRTTTLLYGTLT